MTDNQDFNKQAAKNLKKTFELTEVAKKLNIAEDRRKHPEIPEDELERRFWRRMAYAKDVESRKYAE